MNDGIRAELEALRKQRLVSGSFARRGHVVVPQTIRVGVTFRTDQRGSAHEYDCNGILAMNRMRDSQGRPRFPFNVETVTLPRGATGEVTPERKPSLSDLDGIDLLYIPGGPTANDTQEGSSEDTAKNKAERELNRVFDKDKNATGNRKRIYDEHVSRAGYELRLLGIAKSRGIPILAVCAGSWRLLESYGGKVRTLEVSQRDHHKAKKSEDTWKIENMLKMVDGKTLAQMMLHKSYAALRNAPGVPMITLSNAHSTDPLVLGVNSTHWAVASTVTTNGLQKLASGDDDPSLLLAISAFDVDTDTVEAFESLYGPPTMGIQWHPESYLPGMPGHDAASPDARGVSQALFEFMILAAQTHRKGVNIAGLLNLEGRAFDLLCRSVELRVKNRYVDSRNAYAGVSNLLSRDKWSGRMEVVDEVFDMLDQSDAEMRAGRPVSAGNLYRNAQSRMRDYGLVI